MINAFFMESCSLHDRCVQRLVECGRFSSARRVRLFKMLLKTTNDDKVLAVDTKCGPNKGEFR